MTVIVEPGVLPDAEAELYAALAADIAYVAAHGVPPPGALDGAPVLHGWCRTLTPHTALIGRISGHRAVTTPTIFIISDDGSYARTLRGWLRLGRHVDQMDVLNG